MRSESESVSLYSPVQTTLERPMKWITRKAGQDQDEEEMPAEGTRFEAWWRNGRMTHQDSQGPQSPASTQNNLREKGNGQSRRRIECGELDRDLLSQWAKFHFLRMHNGKERKCKAKRAAVQPLSCSTNLALSLWFCRERKVKEIQDFAKGRRKQTNRKVPTEAQQAERLASWRRNWRVKQHLQDKEKTQFRGLKVNQVDQ